jgi:hypothetical protein
MNRVVNSAMLRCGDRRQDEVCAADSPLSLRLCCCTF